MSSILGIEQVFLLPQVRSCNYILLLIYEDSVLELKEVDCSCSYIVFLMHLLITRIKFYAVVMDNYKNAPQYLYGLSPSQMDMFMTEDNPVRRQSEAVTEVHSLYIPLYLFLHIELVIIQQPNNFINRKFLVPVWGNI